MKKKQNISIKDISKELGISITTISFVINNKAKGRISDEVIEKVQAYIDKVGYRPNSSAQTLRTGKTKTIVFMAEDISDPFFSAVAKEMEDIAYKDGYKIIYCSTENNKKRTMELISLFQYRQVDAFIITPPEDFNMEIEKLLSRQNEIVMVFDRYYEKLNHNYVVLDNFNGAKKAAQSLIDNGCEHIAYVGIECHFSCMLERNNGYRSAVRFHQSKSLDFYLPYVDVRSSNGRKLFKEFINDHPEIDGLLFATNGLTINGLKVLRELQIKIPKDIAVITFDDRDLFELHTPPISVLSQPVSDLAKELIKGTLQLLKRNTDISKPFQKILPGKLIIRGSSQKNC